MALEWLTERLQPRAAGGGDGRTSMWMIYVAVAVDLTSDGLMIGSGSAVSSNLELVLAACQVLADLPEGYATAANFRNKGMPRLRSEEHTSELKSLMRNTSAVLCVKKKNI